ncbi:S41 family peptidase [Chitinophaga filiformis]|uniref:Peptidase family S41 n=1 Tax=Chitinophaga filiformis TaxID=104663 RepID=A0A1G7XA55_CHIFI|nr:S41 family peptidase [Chitinophaga filiformis]SDG81048.1 Peptidase family S41 [Chitinophaga filiformis]
MNKHFTLAMKMVVAGVVFSAVFSACRKKDSTKVDNTTPTSSTVVTDEDSLKYLMYRIMQVTYVDGGRNKTTDLPTYFWYTQVPQLDPSSSTYATADDLLSTMKTYSKNSAGTVLDRYSFLDRTGSLSSSLQNGLSETFNKVSATGNYGMEVSYASDGSKSYLYIVYADKNSPAGQKGLTRGDEITAVNGDSNISYDGANGANVSKVTNAIYYSTSVTLKVKKAVTGAEANYTLTSGTFTINPVLFDTVYTVNSQKVGYFVFYTFTSTYNTQGAATLTKTKLDALFAKYKAAGITNLIVDLRYNQGGSVTTAEYLDSAIAPASAAGKTMYYYQYNDKLTANLDGTGLETSVKFPNVTGGLNLNNVFFITGSHTASASELTLNNLLPYMNVKLVGDTTYGKPVGFITFNISKYDSTHTKQYLADLYAINFATENASHVGGYYTGIAPDQVANDYVNVPWGYRNDDENLDRIFSYITTGSFARTSANARVLTETAVNQRAAIPSSIASPRFNGMVDYRIGKRIQ